jgi:lysyl-tRNA synthetase class 2
MAGPDADWRPAASFEALRARADLLARTRSFFAARGVLEVETSLLSWAGVTDVHIEGIRCAPEVAGGTELFLQTSPEYAMKRLLAAGSGAIYQVCRAFRDGESGARHNPEFSMLEWYRPGFDHHQLMDEVDALLAELLGTAAADRWTFREVFERHLKLDPHEAPVAVLAAAARDLVGRIDGLDAEDRDGWLQLLLGSVLEPALGHERPAFVHDFPASCAALARVRDGDPPVAERFEVYVRGVELANGYHELGDAAEQARRFEQDRQRRRRAGKREVADDPRLVAALEHGLPSCAGVALGFDRLVMLALGAADLGQVIAFPFDRA